VRGRKKIAAVFKLVTKAPFNGKLGGNVSGKRKKMPIDEVLEALSGADSILMTGHLRPDGDALGSAVALGRVMAQLGKKVTIAVDLGFLGNVAFLRDNAPLTDLETAATGNYDLFVLLDCGGANRIPLPLRPVAEKITLCNIDHHRTNTRFGAINWIDGNASSTSEMVWRLTKRGDWRLDRESAEALWVGLVTDTGRFAHDQTRPTTMRCGANLLKYGVRTAWINDRLYGSFSPQVLELKRRAYNSLQIWRDGEVATVMLTYADFCETKCNKSDVEDVVDIPRSLAGSRVAIFFYEGSPAEGVTRLSIRTRTPLDATELAQIYGGGGHARAAGCTVRASLAEAITQVREAVDAWLNAQPHETI